MGREKSIKWPYRGFLILCFLHFIIGEYSSAVGVNNQRKVRSPGLFDKLPSLSPPGDLGEKLKPVTLADLNAIKEQIKSFSNFTNYFNQVVAAEKQARMGLQNLLETAKERITSLESSVYPDQNFWAESELCGGIIIAQTGKISYKADRTYVNYERCVWTVRTNYRSKVKVDFITSGFESDEYDFVTVTELSADGNNFRTVKFTKNTKHLFEGPVLIISFLTDWSSTERGFTLEFEGLGRNLDKNIAYKHFHLDDYSGSFSAANITENGNKINAQSMQSKPTRLFSTIILNPQYKNVTQLRININEGSVHLKPEDCEKSVIQFYDNFLESNSSSKRCCGTKCDKSKYINNDGMFLITSSNEFESSKSNEFKFTWELDTEIPHNDSVDTCGGVLSGRVGQISYKANEQYKNNERCVWVIKSTGKSKIKLALQKQDFEDGYDYLLATTLKVETQPESIALRHSHYYNFSGPIFITFYTDSSSEGKGFVLAWEDIGSTVYEDSIQEDTIYLDADSGSQDLELNSPVLQTVVINPKYLDGSMLNLKLTAFNANLGDNCGTNGLYIYGSDEQNYSLAQSYCKNNEGGFNPEEFQTLDGVFILAYRADSSIGKTAISFSWKKGPKAKQPVLEGQQYVEQTEGCGGILIGDAGKIEYKLNSSYESNERCTWVIQSARFSKLTLKLTKDSFESCCDYLIAAPLISENGTVGAPSKINRDYKTKSFANTVVFITFYSDGSITGNGFILEFTTGGDIHNDHLKYTHKILSELSGSVSYPTENEILPSKNEILTFVLSPEPIKDGTTPTDSLQTNVSIEVQQLGSDKQCSKDSLSFAAVSVKTVPMFSNRFTCSSGTACDCPPNSGNITNEFTIGDRFFISIFKSVDSTEGKSLRIAWNSSDTSAGAEAE